MKSMIIKASAMVMLILHLTACGTILHPERKGQTGGRIDPAIAALNGVGLLLFIIPGAVAFAIDFSNGAIYLPGTGNVDHDNDIRVVQSNRLMSPTELQQLVEQQTGETVSLSDATIEQVSVTSEQELQAALQRFRP